MLESVQRWRKKGEPYIFMALTICNRYSLRKQTENRKIFSKSLLTWFSSITLSLCLMSQAIAQDKVQDKAPELSLLPWQLIGLDNEFATRNTKKLKALHSQIQASLLTEAKPLDLWIEAEGRTLPLNLKHSLHPVQSGKAKGSVSAPAYVLPVLCRVGEDIVVATELLNLSDNFLLSAKQQFTARAAWEGESAPITIADNWGQELFEKIRLPETEAAAFKVDLGLLRSSHNTIKGSHECLNMLVAHELQKTMMVPTPLDLLEGYRLRQTLLTGSAPKRSTRTFLLDWGRDPKGPKLAAQVISSESVLGSPMKPRGPMTFEIKSTENRIELPEDFKQALNDFRSQLLTEDKPQVAKVYGAWVYLDRGRAWGLDMNDRLYFEEGSRFVKGHVVGFFGSGLNLKSPRGFPIQEGAIVFIRKGQREVKVGDTFGFDPTSYPTPFPPVRQPSKAQL